MEARHELHYLQHGHVNHRALQINGSNMDALIINLVHRSPGAALTLNVTAHTANLAGCLMATSCNKRGRATLRVDEERPNTPLSFHLCES